MLVLFTIRRAGGVALFLAGTTWLWLAPAFATRGVGTSGVVWSAATVLSLLTVLGVYVGTVGLVTRQSRGEGAAVVSAVVGPQAPVPSRPAAARGGETTGTVAGRASVHVPVAAGVCALLLVPRLERRAQCHVMSV